MVKTRILLARRGLLGDSGLEAEEESVFEVEESERVFAYDGGG